MILRNGHASVGPWRLQDYEDRKLSAIHCINMEKCVKSSPNVVEKIRTRNQTKNESNVSNDAPVLSDMSITEGLKKGDSKSSRISSVHRKKADNMNSKSTALKRAGPDLNNLSQSACSIDLKHARITQNTSISNALKNTQNKSRENRNLYHSESSIDLKRSTRSSQKIEILKASSKKRKNLSENSNLHHSVPNIDLKKSRRSSQKVEILKASSKTNISENDLLSPSETIYDQKHTTRRSKNEEITKFLSEKIGISKEDIQITPSNPSSEKKRCVKRSKGEKKMSSKDVQKSTHRPSQDEKKIRRSSNNVEVPKPFYKKFKLLQEHDGLSGAVEQDLLLDTSVEYDDNKVDIAFVYKVNKLFINDLKYPQLSHFGLINFSCSSATGCSKKNHLNLLEQLSIAEEEILMFYVYEKCWYLLLHPLMCSITENVHLSPALLRSIMYGIVTEVNNNISTNLVKIFKTHLKLHPPCRKELKNLYKTVLLDPINIGKLNDPIVQYNLQNIINKIEKTLEEMSTKISTPQEKKCHKEEEDKLKISLSSNNESKLRLVPEDFVNFLGDKFKKAEDQVTDEIIDSNILLQRLFLILSLSLDILEENFRMWWMKSRYKLKEALKNACPFIVSACWKKSEKIGSLNEHCLQVFALFMKCPCEYKHHLSRYITLLFYIAQINENNEERKFPFFHDLCNAFAAELTAHIQKGETEPNENILVMIQYINPPWLRFRICGILLKSEITSGGKNDLRSAYRIILRNLTASNKVLAKSLRNKSQQEPLKPNSKCPKGETVLHKYCRQGKVKSVNNILIKNQANVNIQDTEGWTPLHNAAFYNSVDCVNQLIKYRLPPIPGAEELNINALNFNNDTPLILAIQKENYEVVDILLQNGAGTSVWNKNLEGYSANDLAPSDLKEKCIDFWNKSIALFDYLQMTPTEIDILSTMISAYCLCFHVKENNFNENDGFSSRPDEYYKYDYACYLKDCITFERLTLVIHRLCSDSSNLNLMNLLHFLTSHC